MGYINKSFESRYSRKNSFVKFIFLFHFFFQTAAKLKIYSDNLTD